jgi:polysaccharide deacetylase family protein (PEP-CTERM system associated)
MRAPDIITIDVEEWFHGHNYLSKVPPEKWEDQESRVEQGTALCLDLLDRYQVKATFFVLGWTAERHPQLVGQIRERGHEIGCHSYSHPVIFEMTRDEFLADTERALEILQRCGAGDVAGFRAPSFSITPPVHSYLEVLQELGFRYDSSIFPVRHPRYGQPGSPRSPYKLAEAEEALIEIPMPTWRFLGQNVPYSGVATCACCPGPLSPPCVAWPVDRVCPASPTCTPGNWTISNPGLAWTPPPKPAAPPGRTPCRPNWRRSWPVGTS